MRNDLKIASPQQIGPLQVWPLMWERLVSHQRNLPVGITDLIFDEYEEEDVGPVINWIQALNPTQSPVFIPAGWLISEGLLQDRILVAAEYIEAESSKTIMVSCVEKGRWEPSESYRRTMRAPMSVLGAGFDFDSNKGLWVLDSKTRQERVWQQVESQEARSGERPTHSLVQIMQEDSEKCELQKSVIKVMNEKLRILPQQNGIMIALNGKPLISEFFSDSLEIANTVRKTILASSFDTTNMSRSQINKSDVERFLDEVLGTKIHALNNEDWGVHLSGGTDSLDTHLTKDSGERLLRMSTLNRSHPALIGV
jgi:sulfur transfer complex TusBCD TusB component (DsrH family)